MSAADSTFFTLNEVATLIWQSADGQTPLSEIVEQKICQEYEIEQEVAHRDAEEFVSALSQHRILAVSDQPITRSQKFAEASNTLASAQAGRGRLAQDFSPYAIDCVLRIVHSLIQAQAGGFLLHGASAIRNGKAFLFSGISGAGKTTISSLIPKDAALLTDEISYVRRDGEEFAGELARSGENACAPITRLFFLTKGPENRIDPVETPDGVQQAFRHLRT